MSLKIFIHGLESSTQGTKSVYFGQKYPDMVLQDFVGDLNQRMEKLNSLLQGESDIRLVGSSFGGLMATLFAMENESRIAKMILLAPAINMLTSTQRKKRISMPVWIYHGRNDDVIPLDQVEPIAKEIFTNLSFQAVDDDHYLHKIFKSIDWHSLLS